MTVLAFTTDSVWGNHDFKSFCYQKGRPAGQHIGKTCSMIELSFSCEIKKKKRSLRKTNKQTKNIFGFFDSSRLWEMSQQCLIYRDINFTMQQSETLSYYWNKTHRLDLPLIHPNKHFADFCTRLFFSGLPKWNESLNHTLRYLFSAE